MIEIIFDKLMTRLMVSFDSATYQFEHDSYDEELYLGKAGFYATFITSKGRAEWFGAHKHVFSDSCVKNQEKAIKEYAKP